MILYNEKTRTSQYPLVFLKTDSGKRINDLIYTIVTNDAGKTHHKFGWCDVTAKVLCTNKKMPAGKTNCYLEQNRLFLPDGEALDVVVLAYDPVGDFGYATFTCLAHYE